MTMNALEPAAPQSFSSRLLLWVPRILSSKIHILWLFVLFFWIVVWAAISPDSVSQRTELILGNYTNVTSAIGACIAAGGTLVAVKHLRKQSATQDARLKLEEERHALAKESHAMLTQLTNSKPGQ